MVEPSQQPSSSATPGVVFVSIAEFYWLTLGVWVGGLVILTLMPYLLIPRIGMGFGVAGSYLLFFLCWQPIQVVTQRTFGIRTAMIRLVMFVASAATLAFYLRENMLALTR